MAADVQLVECSCSELQTVSSQAKPVVGQCFHAVLIVLRKYKLHKTVKTSTENFEQVLESK